MDKSKDEIELDLLKLLTSYARRWWLILLTGVLGALLVFFYTKMSFLPTYTYSASVYVNTSSMKISSFSFSDLNSSEKMIPTYQYILKTRDTLSLAADHALGYSVDENSTAEEISQHEYYISTIRGMIGTSSISGTGILTFTVRSTDQALTEEAAKSLLYAFNSRFEGKDPIVEDATPRIVEDVALTSVSQPDYAKKAIIGFVVGAALVLAYLTLIEIFNDTVRSEDWVERTFKDQIPLLAIIPDAEADSLKGKYYKSKKSGYYGYSGYSGYYSSYGSYGSYGYYSQGKSKK